MSRKKQSFLSILGQNLTEALSMDDVSRELAQARRQDAEVRQARLAARTQEEINIDIISDNCMQHGTCYPIVEGEQ